MLSVGETAPKFELPNQHGEQVTLSEFRGKRVVLYFYPRANTSGCTIEARQFNDRLDAFDANDTVVIGVSDDPVDDLADFADEYDLDFHLLSDESGELATLYDSYGEKQAFGNTFDGVFRNTYVIDDSGTVAAVFEGVSPDGHPDEVLDTIESFD